MKRQRLHFIVLTGLMQSALFVGSLQVALAAVHMPAGAWSETILHSFTGGPGGADPTSGLVFGASGMLYGTTFSGSHQDGTIYTLTPSSSGYTFATIVRFQNEVQGYRPDAPLTVAGPTTLFGNTTLGGPTANGNVFELTQSSSGTYTMTDLFDFNYGDGSGPFAPIVDVAGTLIGTTGTGGKYQEGEVYELVPSSSGYALNVLHSFHYPTDGDGSAPSAFLVDPQTGVIYGTTFGGGNQCGVGGCGTVYSLTPGSSGYTLTVLYAFDGEPNDGASPLSLYRSSDGTLYGTTSNGGTLNRGTFFDLVPSASGYHERMLYSFKGTENDGRSPISNLVAATNGVFYGVTNKGGRYHLGSAFELSPDQRNSSNGYMETVIHDFAGKSAGGIVDGARPVGGLLMDQNGALYGTTQFGGTGGCRTYPPRMGCGTVFRLSLSTSR